LKSNLIGLKIEASEVPGGTIRDVMKDEYYLRVVIGRSHWDIPRRKSLVAAIRKSINLRNNK